MILRVDTHTHTISSGHAYSTIQEMARGAAENGISMMAVTDHGPAMPGGPHLYHFNNIRVVPPSIYGVRILKGVEANIIDMSGGTDMPDEYLGRLDFVMASFHDMCLEPSTVENNTKALIGVLSNPYVDAVSHPGNPAFPVDIERVVLAAGEYGKLLEINNHSFRVRKGSEKNCREFAVLCKRYEVCVVCGSDAHISSDVGRFDNVLKLFEDVGMPEELVMCTSPGKLDGYLQKKRERLRIQPYNKLL